MENLGALGADESGGLAQVFAMFYFLVTLYKAYRASQSGRPSFYDGDDAESLFHRKTLVVSSHQRLGGKILLCSYVRVAEWHNEWRFTDAGR